VCVGREGVFHSCVYTGPRGVSGPTLMALPLESRASPNPAGQAGVVKIHMPGGLQRAPQAGAAEGGGDGPVRDGGPKEGQLGQDLS